MKPPSEYRAGAGPRRSTWESSPVSPAAVCSVLSESPPAMRRATVPPPVHRCGQRCLRPHRARRRSHGSRRRHGRGGLHATLCHTGSGTAASAPAWPLRRALVGASESVLELPGSRQSPLFSARSSTPRTRAPFLPRYYPSSPVIWAPPTPVGPASRGSGATVAARQVSRVASPRVCVRAAPTTPASRTTLTCRWIESSSAAFVYAVETRRSHYRFRGLLRLHSRCGPHACWPA
jgi:hypothetical protein